jgi:hypothetical protein
MMRCHGYINWHFLLECWYNQLFEIPGIPYYTNYVSKINMKISGWWFGT